MADAAGSLRLAIDQDQKISEAVERDRARLRRFIRRYVADESDVEDVLQEVFYELVEAYRLMKPVERVSAWLFRVARNRIIDLFRRKGTLDRAGASTGSVEDAEPAALEDLLPSPDAGPDAVYARNLLLDELEHALDELPEEQRDVFVAHELEGRSFRQLAAETGIGVNTLLSRKHYAVRYLRRRLQSIYDEFTRR